eukprot:jgi/Ulvmu1/1730/UM117_0007.1
MIARDAIMVCLSLANIGLLIRICSRWQGNPTQINMFPQAVGVESVSVTTLLKQSELPKVSSLPTQARSAERDMSTVGLLTQHVYASSLETQVKVDSLHDPVEALNVSTTLAVDGAEGATVNSDHHKCARSTSLNESLAHARPSSDPYSLFMVLLDNFDAFMEVWAAHAKPSYPYFFWATMEACALEESVHPLKAAGLLATHAQLHRYQGRLAMGGNTLEEKTVISGDLSMISTALQPGHANGHPVLQGTPSPQPAGHHNGIDLAILGLQISQSQGLWILVAITAAFIAWRFASMLHGSPATCEKPFETADYACQVGNGALDCLHPQATTRLSASRLAATAARTACEIIHGTVARVSSGAGAWKRNGGRLRRASVLNRQTTDTVWEEGVDGSPNQATDVIDDDGMRENTLCGFPRTSSAAKSTRPSSGVLPHIRPEGRPSAPSCYMQGNGGHTDTMIETMMDHDTQLQGRLSVRQPIWNSGAGTCDVGY